MCCIIIQHQGNSSLKSGISSIKLAQPINKNVTSHPGNAVRFIFNHFRTSGKYFLKQRGVANLPITTMGVFAETKKARKESTVSTEEILHLRAPWARTYCIITLVTHVAPAGIYWAWRVCWKGAFGKLFLIKSFFTSQTMFAEQL